MTRFLAVGHVTRDEFEDDPQWRLGGTVLYSAAAAARLGADAAIVTRVGPNERRALEERCRMLGIALHAHASETTTTFAFHYEGERRILRLRARARGLRLADVPEELRGSDAVMLGAVAHEIDRSLVGAFHGRAVVVTAQGFLREWGADGTIRPRRWDDVADVTASATAIVLSEEDVAGDLSEPRRWAAHTPVIVTLAQRGALVMGDGAEHRVPAFHADRVVDPTGAGDAFAAGLAVASAEGRALDDAVRFAHAVASFAIEAVGTEGLADRARVEARMSSSREA